MRKSRHTGTELTPMQEKFCQEYLLNPDGNAAAIKAGFSKKGARVRASTMLKMPKVKAFFAANRKKAATKLEISIEGIAREYQQIVSANIVDFLDENGGITNLKNLPREITAAIESIKVSEYFDKKQQQIVRVIHFKLHNKNAALEALGKHLGFFEKDNKQKSELTLNGSITDIKSLSEKDLDQVISQLQGKLKKK